jgi:predicted Zn-dependent protease
MVPPRFARPILQSLLILLVFMSWMAMPATAWCQNGRTPLDDFFQNFMRMTPQQRAELQKVEVPWKVEEDQGRQTFESYRRYLRQSDITLSDQSEDARYVQQLVARIHPHMKHARRYRQLHVYIADSPEVDARSIPGGYLIFYRGLLEFAESEAALVGIIGHELSHLDRGHQLKPIRQMLQAQRRLSRADRLNLGDFFSLGQGMMNSFHPFHPEEEEEADQDGLQWMHQVGYDGRELARLFQRLAERPRPGAAAAMPAFLRTHPLYPDRAAATLRHLQHLQRVAPRDDLVIGKEALAERSPAEMPDRRRRGRR